MGLRGFSLHRSRGWWACVTLEDGGRFFLLRKDRFIGMLAHTMLRDICTETRRLCFGYRLHWRAETATWSAIQQRWLLGSLDVVLCWRWFGLLAISLSKSLYNVSPGLRLLCAWCS
jgi:hypothetical protein